MVGLAEAKPQPLKPARLLTPLETDNASPKKGSRFKKWLSFSLIEALLLAAALLCAYLPVDWTRDLKRIKQGPFYGWQSLAFFLVYAFAAWWTLRPSNKPLLNRPKWVALTLLVLLPNLFNIWLRSTAQTTGGGLLFGRDADIGLFFKYGHDFAAGHYPTNFQGQYMEYPQMALFLFLAGEILSAGNLEAFYWVFPLLLVFFQLIAAFALYGMGKKMGRNREGFLLAAFVAGCPALLSFSYTRFDVVPAALLLGTIYFFLPPGNSARQPENIRAAWSGLLNGLGGLVKWLPAIITPWLVAAMVQSRHWRQLSFFLGASLILGLTVLIPFYFWNPEAFWYPYKYQGSRNLIGESFWFLIQREFFDPQHLTPDKPWGEPAKIILGNNKTLAGQLVLTGGVFALTLWRLGFLKREESMKNWTGWVVSGLVGVAVFTLSNRIFSPQYLIFLAWVWAGAVVLTRTGWIFLVASLALISIAAAANFQVYLLGVYPEEWLRDSWIMFGAGWLLSGALLWTSLVEKKGE